MARGEARPESDVDLLVTLRPDKREALDIFQASGLQVNLSRIVGAHVQVVPAGRLSQRFLDNITPDLIDVFHWPGAAMRGHCEGCRSNPE